MRLIFSNVLLYVLLLSSYLLGELDSPYKNKPYWYKVQLHCHSNESDGLQNPKKVMKAYKNEGYDAVALTDHNKVTDPEWVPGIIHIAGGEQNESGDHHIVGVYLTDNNTVPLPDIDKNGDGLPDYDPRDFDNVQPSIDYLRTRDAISILAHPSTEDGWDLSDLHILYGYTGIEIYNAWYSTEEYRESVDDLWTSLLYGGRKKWGFSTDDCHNIYKATSSRGRDERHFNRGWIMVNLDKSSPSRKDIVKNIKNGNFYSCVRARTWFSTQPNDGYDDWEPCRPNWYIPKIKSITGSTKLKRIFVIHETSTTEHAGTDDYAYIKIKGNKRSLPGNPLDERRPGYTDSYNIGIIDYNIDINSLNTNDIKLGISGDNAWLPKTIWVIGETIDNNYLMLAGDDNWPSNDWFSTDPSEGEKSYVIPLIETDYSSTIDKVFLVHRTSWAKYANTDNLFTLSLEGYSLDVPELPYNEREYGYTDMYKMDYSNYNLNLNSFDDWSIRLRTTDEDAWLPEAIWIIAKTTSGNIRLIGGTPYWGCLPPEIQIILPGNDVIRVRLKNVEGPYASIKVYTENGFVHNAILEENQTFDFPTYNYNTLYVRFEATDYYGSTTYSQPIFVDY